MIINNVDDKRREKYYADQKEKHKFYLHTIQKYTLNEEEKKRKKNV